MDTAAEKKAAEEKAAAEKKAAAEQAALADRFKTKRKLVMPLLKFQTNVPVYVKPTGPHFTGKGVDKKKADDKKREPAEICNVIDLTTGEEVQIIVAAVVQSVWEDEYPKDSYVGKGFKITKGVKAAGKQYFQYSVDEIELPK